MTAAKVNVLCVVEFRAKSKLDNMLKKIIFKWLIANLKLNIQGEFF